MGQKRYIIEGDVHSHGGRVVSGAPNSRIDHSILTGVGVEYFLSKLTTLYGQFAFVNNHGKMNTGLSLNGALYASQGSTSGAVVGIRHAF